jgi:hypothetical protein
MSKPLRWLICWAACLGGAGLIDRPALAQTRQMQIDMDSSTPAPRSLAPILVVWRVTSHSSNLTEGHFEIMLTDDREVLARVETEDVVLSAGQQTIRTLLPPLDSITHFPELTLHVRFIGKRETLNLGKHLLRVPPITQRGLVVGVSNPWQSATSPALDSLLQQTRLEKMIPEPTEGRSLTLSTSHSRMLPGDLPQTALGYCVFDLLLLPEDGFSTLRAQQLAAILDWVRAGGSVCVVPGRVVLTPAHVGFLNSLFATSSGTPPYLLDSTGHLMPPADVAPDDPSPQSYRVGLGRAVVVLGSPDQSATWWNSPAWREAVAFLWKVRHDQIATLTADSNQAPQAKATDEQTKRASPEKPATRGGGVGSEPEVIISELPPTAAGLAPAPGMVAGGYYPLDAYTQFHSWAPIPIHTLDQLLFKLMPDSMRVMPLGLMMLMLGVYVLVIGPGDYFGLGLIKRRKWTWVLFPTVTIGFAVFLLLLSQWFLGITDNRRSLVIVDLGDDGRVVRQNQIELVITSTTRSVATPVRQAYFAPIAHQHFGGSMPWNQMQFAGATPYRTAVMATGFNPNQRDASDPGPTSYVGRVPSQFTATQNQPQWTPRLNRQLSIQPNDSDVVVDWDRVRSLLPDPASVPTPPVTTPPWIDPNLRFDQATTMPPAEVKGTGDVRSLEDYLLPCFGNRAAVSVLHGPDKLWAAGNASPMFTDQANQGRHVQVTRTVNGRTQTVWEPDISTTNFLRDISVVEQPGFFSTVSQISPSGGHTFDDLTLLDPSDERLWLVVVTIPRGQDFVMYRKVLGK